VTDDWDPEPWVARTELPKAPASEKPPAQVRPPIRPKAAPGRDRSILGIALTQSLTGIVALLVSVIPILNVPGNWPRAIIFLIVVLLIGCITSQEDGPTLFTRGWVSSLIAVVAVMPIAALTVTLARQPHVSLRAGSAWSSIGLTLILSSVLIGISIGFAIWSSDEPDESGLLMLPSALLIPAVIGIRGEVDEQSALRAVALATIVASFAALMSWSVARPLRAFAPPVALCVTVLSLWLTGHGPTFTTTSGQIVPLLFSLLFTVTVLVGVATSGLSAFAHQIELESRPSYARDIEGDAARANMAQRPPLR
jgi:hypothetical protein